MVLYKNFLCDLKFLHQKINLFEASYDEVDVYEAAPPFLTVDEDFKDDI